MTEELNRVDFCICWFVDAICITGEMGCARVLGKYESEFTGDGGGPMTLAARQRLSADLGQAEMSFPARAESHGYLVETGDGADRKPQTHT